MIHTTSVLIPSFQRLARLSACLRGLARQTVATDQVVVVWQAEDTATRDHARSLATELGLAIDVVHSPERGVVPAENHALLHAKGSIILLIDDDAVPPPDWIEKHKAHYQDPTIGAVGGSADNFWPDEHHRLPIRNHQPCGKLTWFGSFIGNMYDQPPEWRSLAPKPADHLVGYNLSLRRSAFDQFESGLRPYWQLFEADACLQARDRGFRVVFDPSIVVAHYPSNTSNAYTRGFDGDLTIKVDNGTFNSAFVLSKHTSSNPLRLARFLFITLVGSRSLPGPLLLPLALVRSRNPRLQIEIARRAWTNRKAGWRKGRTKTTPSQDTHNHTTQAPSPDIQKNHRADSHTAHPGRDPRETSPLARVEQNT